MLFKYAKEDIYKYCERHYECTSLNPAVRKEKLFMVVDKVATPAEKRIIHILWSKNPATNKKYTTGETADLLGYTRNMVSNARQEVIMKTVRPLHGLMDYHNEQPLKTKDKSNRIKFPLISFQHYNSANDVKSTIKYLHTGICEVETECHGEITKRTIKHRLSFDEFEQVCEGIDNNPLFPHAHRRENDGDYIRMVLRNGTVGCNNLDFFVDKNIHSTPIKYIRVLEKAIDEEHPFFKELNKRTDGIEISYTGPWLFGIPPED